MGGDRFRYERGGGGGSASSGAFTPSVPADWMPVPSTDHAALDQLAARVTDLEALFMTRPGNGSNSTKSLTTATQIILGADATRLGFVLKNEGPGTAYIAYAAAAALTAYTLTLDPDSEHIDSTGYTGPLSGITLAGTAVLRITALIP